MNAASSTSPAGAAAARGAPSPPGGARHHVADACAQVRRLPIGAELLASGGAHFRVWAPAVESVAVEILADDAAVASVEPLQPEGNGYFSGKCDRAAIGTRYRFRLPQGSYPDPASRFQPQGPHGPSQVVSPAYHWHDGAWTGRPTSELVVYELHLGTFTREGTWAAATRELAALAQLGVTAVEIMPIADFPGRYGWGYDGVNLFAPSRLYGTPDEARAFVDAAHQLELMVILDVVYNHLGPDGCYVREFSRDYFSEKYRNEWGDPMNFDGPNCGPVREFYLSNARYWIEEFHCDGLRLDATQQIFDTSETHILADISATVRAAAAGRHTFVVGENETQEAKLMRSRPRGGYEMDAVWNDDFHHSAAVVATGRRQAYYRDYRGSPQEFISAAKYGFLFQGQLSSWQQKRRGSSVFDLSPNRFVTFLQNHDQVANSLRGERVHQQTSPGMLRALTALQLLTPSIPMLFQGQEFAASAPFLYFVDHRPELGAKVAAGRAEFLRQFNSIAADDAAGAIPDCRKPETFERCKLDFGERKRHRAVYDLHRDLLRLRREDPGLRRPARLDGAVLAERAFVLRFFASGDDCDRLLIVNLGGDLHLSQAPEPLLAPPDDRGWRVAWSSESPVYGGGGTPPLETDANWFLLGPAAFVLAPAPNRELPRSKTTEKD